MVCPDPRAFALHKIWMNAQPDRNPLKKQRDHNQIRRCSLSGAQLHATAQFYFFGTTNVPKKRCRYDDRGNYETRIPYRI